MDESMSHPWKINSKVSTPLCMGVVWGFDGEGSVLVAHHRDDLPVGTECRGPVLIRWYKTSDCSDLSVVQYNKLKKSKRRQHAVQRSTNGDTTALTNDLIDSTADRTDSGVDLSSKEARSKPSRGSTTVRTTSCTIIHASS